MHFIEQLFGWTPDGGNGTLEVFLLALSFILVLFALKQKGRFGNESGVGMHRRLHQAQSHRFSAHLGDSKRSLPALLMAAENL
jgi:hypothetical protein